MTLLQIITRLWKLWQCSLKSKASIRYRLQNSVYATEINWKELKGKELKGNKIECEATEETIFTDVLGSKL